MLDLTDLQLGYIVGIIDGEGQIYLNVNTGNPTGRLSYRFGIVISQKYPELLYWLRDTIGSGTVRTYERDVILPRDGKKHHTQTNRYHLSGASGKELIILIAPHVIVKREHCNVLLEFFALPEAKKGYYGDIPTDLQEQRLKLFERFPRPIVKTRQERKREE